MVTHRARGAAIVLAALVAVSCTGPSADLSMVSIPPPRGWEEALAGERELRERHVRSDPESPLAREDAASFAGLEFWEPDPALYFVGDLRVYASPERFDIVTTAGKFRPCERVGWIGFAIDGQAQRLEVYRLLDGTDPNDLFLPFQDATSGHETYPAGRYVSLAGEGGGPWVLDFNRAFNPSCAYGSPDRFACPVTPAENRLPVRIEAGERGYREPR
jgi:uncharacterized protein (DUF1684 family)